MMVTLYIIIITTHLIANIHGLCGQSFSPLNTNHLANCHDFFGKPYSTWSIISTYAVRVSQMHTAHYTANEYWIHMPESSTTFDILLTIVHLVTLWWVTRCCLDNQCLLCNPLMFGSTVCKYVCYSQYHPVVMVIGIWMPHISNLLY